jgi:dienelactone hydrolase
VISEHPVFRLVHLLLPLLLAGLLAAPGTASAALSRTEVLAFETVTLSDQEFLTGNHGGKPVTIAGVLRFPEPRPERAPVVVLLHGSGGIGAYVTDWEQDLNAMGIATFVVDSFSARGIESTLYDQTQLGLLAMVVDAYRALDVLARHPHIDPLRIALMGFSRGGTAALYAGITRFQRAHNPNGAAFAAYLPFYATCMNLRQDTDVADRPIRLFYGDADDYTSLPKCQAYADRLKAADRDFELIVYPGAGHVFDAAAWKTPRKLAKAATLRHCPLAESEAGLIINGETTQPFTYADPCVEYGVTIAYDEKASIAARKKIREFLGALFALP